MSNVLRMDVHRTNCEPVRLIISRLENVRQSGDGFRADCPSVHSSKQALSIRNGKEGQAKLKCFAGCDAVTVLHAIGLELADLYPDRISHATHKSTPQEKARAQQRAKHYRWSVALDTLAFEARIVAVAADQIAKGEPLNHADRERLSLSLGRIAGARAALHAR